MYGITISVFLSRMRERVSSKNSYQPAQSKVVTLTAIRKRDEVSQGLLSRAFFLPSFNLDKKKRRTEYEKNVYQRIRNQRTSG